MSGSNSGSPPDPGVLSWLRNALFSHPDVLPQLQGPESYYGPVGTESTTGVQTATPINQIVAMAGGQPLTQSNLTNARLALDAGMSSGGTFLGEMAPGAPLQGLAHAQYLKSQNYSPETIHSTTGWHQGPDAQWRFEVPDDQARLKIGGSGLEESQIWPGAVAPTRIPGRIPNPDWGSPSKDPTAKLPMYIDNPRPGQTLGDILDHPALYAADPSLQYQPIAPISGMAAMHYNGMYDPSSRLVSMATAKPEDFLSTLLHETQHAIQDKSGFASGANPGMFIAPEEKNFLTQIRDAQSAWNTKLKSVGLDDSFDVDRAIRLVGGNDPALKYYKPEQQAKYKDIYDKLGSEGLLDQHEELAQRQRLADTIQSKAYSAYQNVAGEVESRNVQKRLGMTSQDRSNSPPWETQAVPNSDQVVLGRDALGDPGAREHIKDLLRQGYTPGAHTDSELVYNGPMTSTKPPEVENELVGRLKSLNRQDVNLLVNPTSADLQAVPGSKRAFMDSSGKVIAAWPAKDITHAEIGDAHNGSLLTVSPFAQNIHSSVILTPEGKVYNQNLMGSGYDQPSSALTVAQYLKQFGQRMTGAVK